MFELCRCRAVLLGLLMLWSFSLPAVAGPDAPLTTRFIQGSYDILLPEGWVASLDESGTALVAEGPSYQLLSILVDWDSDQELLAYHEARVLEIDENPRFQASMIRDSGNGTTTTRHTVIEYSLVQGEAIKARTAKSWSFYLAQTSRAGNADRSGVFASIAYTGGVEAADDWIQFLDLILDSLTVMDPQHKGPPRYEVAPNLDSPRLPMPDDLIGEWNGQDVRGDFGFADGYPSLTLLWSASPNLALHSDGRYSSSWAYFDYTATFDESLRIRHSESGTWLLEGGRLFLTPTSYEGEVKVLGEEPERYDDEVKVTREYAVLLHGGKLILRGPCAEYQMLPDCVDSYAGERRVLGFVLEPVNRQGD